MKLISYLGCAILCVSIFSCDDDEMPPVPPTPEEVITTLRYALTNPDGETVTLEFKDIDGDGGDEPVITPGTIQAGILYTGEITLLNESITPSDNITLEVKEEDDEHQLFFSNDFGGTFTYTDMDDDGKPLGITSTFIVDAPMTGNLKITLIHEPMKSAANVEQGDITNAGGTTDIEVSIPVTVE